MTTQTICRGSKVRVPKGTPFFSTGKVRNGVTARDQVVTVHHMLPAVTLFVYKWAEGVARFAWSLGLDRHTAARLEERYGTSDLHQLIPHLSSHSMEGTTEVFTLELEPARVCWAGSGGYWKEVALSAVVPVCGQEPELVTFIGLHDGANLRAYTAWNMGVKNSKNLRELYDWLKIDSDKFRVASPAMWSEISGKFA